MPNTGVDDPRIGFHAISGLPIDAPTLYFHPEILAGGWAWNEGLVLFWLRVQSLLRPTDRVLDFGAGRGRFAELPSDSFVGRLVRLRGRCAELVGFDIDPCVRGNPLLDRAEHAPLGASLPFPDASFDLVVSYSVFEHLADPDFYARELDRVLRPGGWLCASTPNKWGYIALAARAIPNAWHARILRILSPERRQEDVFPTFYRMNTLPRLRALFPGYRECSYVHTGPPAYHGGRIWLARMIRLYNAFVPARLGATLHVFMRKPERAATSERAA